MTAVFLQTRWSPIITISRSIFLFEGSCWSSCGIAQLGSCTNKWSICGRHRRREKKKKRRGRTEQLCREETWLHPVRTHGHLRSSVWFWMWSISAGRRWSLIQATVTEVKPLKAPACYCRMSHSQDVFTDSKLSPTKVICCHAGVRKGLIRLWTLWIETLWLKIYS